MTTHRWKLFDALLLAPWLALFGCGPRTWQAAQTGSGSITRSDGPALFWRTIGRGPDTVVVLHGGVAGHQGYLLQPLVPLSAQHTLLFYDMRGRGRSEAVDTSRLSLAADVDDLEAVRTHFHLGRLRIVAHHFGAAVAAQYAVAHPGQVERMLFVSPFPVHHSLLYEFTFLQGDSVHYASTLSRVGQLNRPESVAAACPVAWSLYFAPWRTDTLTPYGEIATGICDAPADRLAAAVQIRNRIQGGLGMYVWREQMHGVAVPTLVIEGRGTPAIEVAAVRWAQHLPNARVILMDPPYLFPWVHDPARFSATAEEFLGGQWPVAAVKPAPFQATAMAAPDTIRK